MAQCGFGRFKIRPDRALSSFGLTQFGPCAGVSMLLGERTVGKVFFEHAGG